MDFPSVSCVSQRRFLRLSPFPYPSRPSDVQVSRFRFLMDELRSRALGHLMFIEISGDIYQGSASLQESDR
jgi:hypothetical protein